MIRANDIGWNLVCDSANCGESRFYENLRTKEYMRKDAQIDGWTRCRVNGKMIDLCPSCSAKKPKEQEA
jgi:hypothetical protein